jgi:hypothetical protein
MCSPITHSCFSSCWVFSHAALCVQTTLCKLCYLNGRQYIISRIWGSHEGGTLPCSPLKLNWHFGETCRHSLLGRRISQAREPEWSSVTSFTLVPCLAYFSILKMMATYSFETSVDFQRTIRQYIAEDRKPFDMCNHRTRNASTCSKYGCSVSDPRNSHSLHIVNHGGKLRKCKGSMASCAFTSQVECKEHIIHV